VALVGDSNNSAGAEILTIIGAKALLEIQNTPAKLIRGARQPWFFPWRPTPPARPETGKVVVISSASDLAWWRPFDVKMLHWDLSTLVRLVRPGSMTQQELLALPATVDCYWFDIWCGDETVRGQLWECVLQHTPPINDFVI
jgi:hypothetical protein